jgi:alpha-tubulin suppressor-like RCC1 family protein
LGDVSDRSSPTQVGALTDWSQIAGGRFHSHAIKANGTLWSWGVNNTAYQLGIYNKVNLSSPVQVGFIINWTQISTENYSTFGITTF